MDVRRHGCTSCFVNHTVTEELMSFAMAFGNHIHSRACYFLLCMAMLFAQIEFSNVAQLENRDLQMVCLDNGELACALIVCTKHMIAYSNTRKRLCCM
jgi:hypothetical protein